MSLISNRSAPIGNNNQPAHLGSTRKMTTKREGGGRVQAAASQSQQKYKAMAGDDQRWEDFTFALTGKTADQRTPEENEALRQLRQEMFDGDISPQFFEADLPNSGGQNRLPGGVRGAFVAENGGTVLIAPYLRGAQLRKTSDEELGEAMAARAADLGIGVADGDAGARARRVANGEVVTAKSDPTLFQDHASDTVTVLLDGEVVEAEADAGGSIWLGPALVRWSPATISQFEMIIEHLFKSDGVFAGYPENGVLSAEEIINALTRSLDGSLPLPVDAKTKKCIKQMVEKYGEVNPETGYMAVNRGQLAQAISDGYLGLGVSAYAGDGQTVVTVSSGDGMPGAATEQLAAEILQTYRTGQTSDEAFLALNEFSPQQKSAIVSEMMETDPEITAAFLLHHSSETDLSWYMNQFSPDQASDFLTNMVLASQNPRGSLAANDADKLLRLMTQADPAIVAHAITFIEPQDLANFFATALGGSYSQDPALVAKVLQRVPDKEWQLSVLLKMPSADAAKVAGEIGKIDPQHGNRILKSIGATGHQVEGAPDAPPLPFSTQEIHDVNEITNQALIAELQAAPEGSKAKQLFNLYKAHAIATQDPDFKGKVDIKKIEADIAALHADPEILALMKTNLTAATAEVLGLTPLQAAQEIKTSFIAYVQTPEFLSLPKDQRQAYINDALGMMAMFDAPTAKKAVADLKLSVSKSVLSGNYLGQASPDAMDTAVQSLFTMGLGQAKSGAGILGKLFQNIAGFTKQEQKLAELELKKAIQTSVAENGEFDASLIWHAIESSTTASPRVKQGLKTFVSEAENAGVWGSIGVVLGGIAIAQDFTGHGADPNTAWGRTNIAADMMSVLGGGEAATKAFKALGLDKASMKALRAIANFTQKVQGNSAAVEAAEKAIEMVALGNPEGAVDALTTNAAVMANVSKQEAEAFVDAASTASLTDPSLNQLSTQFAENVAATNDVFIPAEADSILSSETGAALEAPSISTASEYADALSNSGEIAALEVAEGEAAIAGSMAMEEGAAISSSSVAYGTKFLQGLGVLGGVANFLYAAGAIKTADDLRKSGDTEGAAYMGVMAGTGIATGMTSTFSAGATFLGFEEAAAVAGPVGWVVGGIGAVVGGVMLLGYYLHEKQKHKTAVREARAFLEGGTGTGKNYMLPGQ